MGNDIDRNFTYHPPKAGQPERYALIRTKAKELAELIDKECPQSRERSLAMTALDSSVMWANASIARSESKEDEADLWVCPTCGRRTESANSPCDDCVNDEDRTTHAS
jgi:rubrerythrin